MYKIIIAKANGRSPKARCCAREAHVGALFHEARCVSYTYVRSLYCIVMYPCIYMCMYVYMNICSYMIIATPSYDTKRPVKPVAP